MNDRYAVTAPSTASIERILDRTYEACRQRALVLADFLAASRTHLELPGSGGADAAVLAGCPA